MYMQSVKIQSKNPFLDGNLFVAENKDNMPGVLFIHGWQSGQDRFFSLAKELADKGFVGLTFDLPGHGETGGDVNTFSIEDYLKAGAAAYDFLVKVQKVDPQNITVIGSSFGSYLGTILSSIRSVRRMALRVPSNYPDDEFEEVKILRSSEHPGVMEWRSKKLDFNATKSLKAVHEFSGDIFIIESEKDEMVPHQTIQNYLDAVTDKTKLKYWTMEDAPHSLTGHPDLIEEYNKTLVDWIIK